MNLSQARVIDPILSSVAQGYRNAEHVGMTLFPPVPVTVAGGQILEFGKEAFQLIMARRAPGSATKRIDLGFLGKSYSLVQDALEGKVAQEIQRDASRVPGVDLGQRAVTTVLRALSLNLEYEQATLATTAANYDSDHKIALTSTAKWSDATCNPVTSIDAGREAVRASVGIYPNTLLLSAQAFNAAKNNPHVIDRFKYTSRDSVTPDMLAAMWDFRRVVVGRAVALNAAGTQQIDIWGNNAILAYVPDGASSQEDPSYGYTYTMQGHPMVETPYYDNNAKSWIYPVTYERVPVQSGILSGYLIQNPA
ncbi:MAG: major capsid protein [Magnetococcales bacterium]|nr:major capsid protein [Magnetococcales bacterium]